VIATAMVEISRAIANREWAQALILLRQAGVDRDAAREFLRFEIASASGLPDRR